MRKFTCNYQTQFQWLNCECGHSYFARRNVIPTLMVSPSIEHSTKSVALQAFSKFFADISQPLSSSYEEGSYTARQ